MWFQVTIELQPKQRGFHLITEDVVRHLPQLQSVSIGMLHLFIQHTSASLTINENADQTVRSDMEAHFNHFIPEGASYYQHTYEGRDDMPAHLKSSTLGCSLMIPITNGQLALGTWQGIYLGEHRKHGGQRRVVATIQGSKATPRLFIANTFL
ncbi:secondary thiamine-phosphate synthase enzyme YjbQ [Vibrio sp. PP-XX7]